MRPNREVLLTKLPKTQNLKINLQVAEFDEPAVLLSDPNSQFSKMIEAAASIQDTDKTSPPAIRSSASPPLKKTSDSPMSKSSSCHDNPSFIADDEIDEEAF